MMNRQDKATERFLSGYNCAQSVLWAFSDEVGLAPQTALKIATGLGAGMGKRQEVCGAVTGGILILGLTHGRGEGQDRTATEETYVKTQQLMSRFESKHGTCKCRELLGGCDISTAAGRKAFTEGDLLNGICKPCVQTVVSILEDMINEVPNKTAGGPGCEPSGR